MFKTYFKIGWRNLFRNKAYSIINIGGLALGMAVAILNGLWLWDEVSFNKYHENYERIASIALSGIDERGKWMGTTVTYPLGTELITNHHSLFKYIIRSSGERERILSVGETKISSTGLYTDEKAPEMFTFRMIAGTWKGLKDTHAIMIAASLSRTLFGDTDPINQTIKINNKTDVIVTGVYEDFPHNTRFHNIKFFGTWNLFLIDNPWIEQRAINDWRNHFIQIYAEILPNTSFQDVTDRIKNVVRYDPADLEKFTLEKREVQLYPMSQWHLFPYEQGRLANGPIRMIWLVGSIGIFVLLLACINFMNLSTARSEKRAKEVGIRKTIGSLRIQLVHQFFCESFLIVTFGFVLALALVNTLLSWFNELAAKQITLPWSLPGFWILSAAFITITSVLAGSYPALFLSSFEPVKVLKGTFRVGRFASVPRKLLVVVQFTVSVSLIICTIVIYQQVQFAKSRPVGYTREGLIMMPMKSADFYGKYDVLRNELKNTGAVLEMSESMGPVTEVYSGNNGFMWRGKDPNLKENFGTLTVTHEHGKTIGWQFIAGRDFSREHASDSLGMVINEAAAKYMGLQNPVGEMVTWTWWQDNREQLTYTILGVVKDVIMESPYKKIDPTLFYVKGHNGGVNWMNIRLNSTISTSDALGKIEGVFKKIIPSAPFEYKFADDEYALKFASEERIGKLTTFFGVLAIFISTLGLFGLASFVAEQRTKEIGIRKILGATIMNIWRMLSKEFVVLVIISCAIAVPVSILFMRNWLENYEYRTDLSVWIFAAASISALVITLFTVSVQILKAAVSNPVDSLRSE